MSSPNSNYNNSYARIAQKRKKITTNREGSITPPISPSIFRCAQIPKTNRDRRKDYRRTAGKSKEISSSEEPTNNTEVLKIPNPFSKSTAKLSTIKNPTGRTFCRLSSLQFKENNRNFRNLKDESHSFESESGIENYLPGPKNSSSDSPLELQKIHTNEYRVPIVRTNTFSKKALYKTPESPNTTLTQIVQDLQKRKHNALLDQLVEVAVDLSHQLNSMKKSMEDMQLRIVERDAEIAQMQIEYSNKKASQRSLDISPSIKKLQYEKNSEELQNITDKFEKTANALDEAILNESKLKEQLDSIINLNQEQKQQIIDLNMSLTNSQKEIKKLLAENQKIKSDLKLKEVYIEQICTSKAIEEKLKENNKQLMSENQELKENVQKLTQRISTKNEEFQQSLDTLQKESNLKFEELKKSKNSEYEIELAHLSSQIEKNKESENNYIFLIEDLNTKKTKAEELAKKYENKIQTMPNASKLEKQLEDEQKQSWLYIQLYEELKEKRTSETVNKEEVKENTNECLIYKEKIKELTEQIEYLSTGTGNPKIENIKLRSQCKELQIKCEMMKRETNNLREEIKTLEATPLNKKFKELKQKYETALEMSKDWQEKLREMVLKQRELSESNTIKSREADRVLEKYAKLISEYEKLEQIKQEISKEVQSYRKGREVTKLRNSFNTIQEKCNAEIKKLKEERDELTKQNDQLMQNAQKFFERHATMALKIQELMEVKNNLEERLRAALSG